MAEKNTETTEQAKIIADSIYALAKGMRLLGTGNITRQDEEPGAIAHLDMTIKDSAAEIASALDGIANAIHALADAVDKSK